jgi:hypothetical protein
VGRQAFREPRKTSNENKRDPWEGRESGAPARVLEGAEKMKLVAMALAFAFTLGVVGSAVACDKNKKGNTVSLTCDKEKKGKV